MMSLPILYLAQAYSKYPQVDGMQLYYEHPAYMFAQMTLKQLWDLGFEVFSPILYTHPFHVAEFCPKIDYVAHDLAIMEGFMKNDGYEKMSCNDCLSYKECLYKKNILISRYDSGVVCVFADDCFSCLAISSCDVGSGGSSSSCFKEDCKHINWQSKGAKAEYDFAHTHHILCVPLKCVLEKGKIDVEDAF